MHPHSCRLKIYRRQRDARIELASYISIFVGANNSGKTWATEAIVMFLTGAKIAPSVVDSMGLVEC
jgi:recombinational DNA repair ATPase RecF